MTRYRYNQQIKPPAPFVHVTVLRPDGSASIDDIPAQLDIAADMTVLPGTIVFQLDLVQLDATAVMGFDHHLNEVPTFLVRLAIRGFEALPIKALGSRDEQFVLLGRDVLNQYRLTLDGPGLTFDIE